MKWAVMLPLVLPVVILASCQESTQAISDPADLQAAGNLTGNRTIVVSSSAELVAALTPENAGRRILVGAGTYAIDAPLTVPDGATLEGEGVMLFDGDGLPTGFAAGARTTLSMTTNVAGDMLTLGDGVTIRGLEIADLPGRAGNVVAVVSRDAGDRVSATISECEIVNPNPIQGAIGHGLVILTLNPNLGADPPPHEGAVITARMVRSLIRTPEGGGGVFAFNRAAQGKVSVTLAGNVVSGGIIANGGVSLPDAVHDSEVGIESHRNLYRDESADPCAVVRLGWNLTGGSGPPFPLTVPGTARNTLRMQSLDDRVERFARAVLATGSRRFFPSPIAGPSTDNSLELKLLGTRISTPSCGGAPFVADLVLAAANAPFDALFPGDGNELRAIVRGVTGSGPRFNRYTDAEGPSGPLPQELQGSENRLRIAGSPEAFDRTNQGIDPRPGAEHFTGASP